MDTPRRPTFASEFPRQPALDALVEAFERGDYARVRSEAPKLQRETDDEAVRKAAGTLVERTRPDPLAVALLVVAAVLLAGMTCYWVVQGHPPPNEPTRPTPGAFPR